MALNCNSLVCSKLGGHLPEIDAAIYSATDTVSAQASLQYRAYYSTSNNLGSVADIKANGTPANSYTADIATANLTGLTLGTTYYVNVLVKDALDNEGDIPVGINESLDDGPCTRPGHEHQSE